jgi:DNA-binding SARP family transcriptional activator
MEITRGFEHKAVAVPSTFKLQMFGLGPTEVYRDGRLLAASDWTFAKPKELLFYLVSSPPKTKEQIGLTFWPDASPGQLRVSLRAALYHMRRALGERGWILYEDGYYKFNRSMDYWYDVEAFETGIELAEKQIPEDKEEAIEALEVAVTLYRGDFISGFAGDEWAVLRREELRGTYLRAMNVLGELLTGEGVYDRAIEVYRSLLSMDNLIEATHRALMRCYALKGERALALRQYNTLVDVLNHELGVAPSFETTALFQSLQ